MNRPYAYVAKPLCSVMREVCVSECERAAPVVSLHYYYCCFTTASISSFIHIHSKTEFQLKPAIL